MHRSTIGVVTAALVLLAPNADALERRGQVEVSLADVDTTTGRGAEQALRRIRNAAEAVCGVRSGLQPYRERAAARACASEAVSQAVDDLADQQVTVRYRGDRSYASTGARS